jgi:hypothetical protein
VLVYGTSGRWAAAFQGKLFAGGPGGNYLGSGGNGRTTRCPDASRLAKCHQQGTKG